MPDGYIAVNELGLADVLSVLGDDEACRRVFRQGIRVNPSALMDLRTRQMVEQVLGRPIGLGEVVRRMEAKDAGKFEVRTKPVV